MNLLRVVGSGSPCVEASLNLVQVLDLYSPQSPSGVAFAQLHDKSTMFRNDPKSVPGKHLCLD